VQTRAINRSRRKMHQCCRITATGYRKNDKPRVPWINQYPVDLIPKPIPKR
jgi:hypothetical protein